MDFKYKDRRVFAHNYLIFFYLESTKARGIELQRALAGQKEGNHSLYAHNPTLSTSSTCNTLCCVLQGDTERGPKGEGSMVCATSATELRRPWRWKLWDFLSSEGQRGVRERAEVSRGFVEEAALALGLKPWEASEEGIIYCSLFTCLVNWRPALQPRGTAAAWAASPALLLTMTTLWPTASYLALLGLTCCLWKGNHFSFLAFLRDANDKFASNAWQSTCPMNYCHWRERMYPLPLKKWSPQRWR